MLIKKHHWNTSDIFQQSYSVTEQVLTAWQIRIRLIRYSKFLCRERVDDLRRNIPSVHLCLSECWELLLCVLGWFWALDLRFNILFNLFLPFIITCSDLLTHTPALTACAVQRRIRKLKSAFIFQIPLSYWNRFSSGASILFCFVCCVFKVTIFLQGCGIGKNISFRLPVTATGCFSFSRSLSLLIL